MSVPPGSAEPASGSIHQPPPMASCDLCEWPMLVPAHCLKTGRIEGLLVCSQCAEDELCARVGFDNEGLSNASAIDTGGPLGLVGSGGGR